VNMCKRKRKIPRRVRSRGVSESRRVVERVERHVFPLSIEYSSLIFVASSVITHLRFLKVSTVFL